MSYFSESPNFPDYLLETSLFLRDSSYCGELYSERYNYDGNKQVCGSRHNKDTCQVGLIVVILSLS